MAERRKSCTKLNIIAEANKVFLAATGWDRHYGRLGVTFRSGVVACDDGLP